MNTSNTVQVEFLGGKSFAGRPVFMEVTYFAEFLRGPDGTCAFCHGDPCAESSPQDSFIARYMQEYKAWAETCPVCDGRPT